ncbi:DUF2510 domain-containing protein [Mycobacterium hodleri]|uniref:DUF2510 domain-containing protein n=1 Tax=Mycolicibacterium hodleri TaxID=49897 RepID=A0A544VZE6_9MYCO|nr:DUF2510 domain-containing protein [Mycolicibacterium hodleri]TQR85344.1 DUF2510 domain-containing protein [Mycolicibacterium hodleri]
MTTPPTPADWYPDPENAGYLRYWDGSSWTEHRAPAPGAAQPPADEPPAYEPPAYEPPADEQATSVVSLPDEATNVYATRPVEQEPTPEGAQQEPVQPYDTHPQASYEPFLADSTPWNPPLPSWDSPSTGQTYAQPEQSSEAPGYETSGSETPSEERPAETPAPQSDPPPFETARFETYEPARFAPPPGPPPGYYSSSTPTGPSGDKPNMKLVAGILGGAAVILVVIAVVVTLAVMRTDQPTVTSQGTTPTDSATTSSETTTSETEAEPTPPESLTPPPPGAEGSDGDFTFSVAGTETGDTVTSNVDASIQSTAQGMYYVVYVNVTNTGAAPITFVATFQQLNVAGQTFPLDDQATALLEGTLAEITPGETTEIPLVYDVPVDTVPTGILLRADPATAGVELPLS